jgi:hypothetical protein
MTENDFYRKVKDLNITKILSFIQYSILKSYVIKLHYLRLEIDILEITSKLNNFNLDVKELCFQDFLKGDKSIFTRKKLEIIKERLNVPTYKCYGIVEEGILIYSTWISYENLGLPVRSNYKLAHDQALLEDSYCHPKLRGMGIHGKMNLYRISKIFEAGKKVVIAIVLDGNKPAFKVQENSGFKEIDYFYAGKIFGISFSNLNVKKI